MTDVTLKLSKPYMAYPPETADKIVLPAAKGMLTVISGRAPLSLILDKGAICLLDRENRLLKRYFVKNASVDAAADVCSVAAEFLMAENEVSRELVLQKAEEAKSEDERDFYQMIFDEISLTGEAK